MKFNKRKRFLFCASKAHQPPNPAIKAYNTKHLEFSWPLINIKKISIHITHNPITHTHTHILRKLIPNIILSNKKKM